MRQNRRSEGGRAILQALGAVALFTLTLGALGPAIDAEPYPPPPPIARDLRGEFARLEADARHRCDRERGANSGWIQLVDGEIACTDKHGRRSRNLSPTSLARQP